MANTKWDKLHKHYKNQDWIGKPNIFAEEVLEYFPKKGKILCLGDGQGQDGRFFASKGYDVTSTDISDEAQNINKEKIKEAGLENITVEKLDLTEKFPYDDASFDVVYAHLSLHYFTEEVTKSIFKEIKRVLKGGGVLAVFTNSVNDPEFNTGKRIEEELFEIEGIQKRFFSKYSMDYFAQDFQIVLLDDNGKTYKDEAKGVHNLIRFIGKNYARRSNQIALSFVSAIVERENDGETEVLIQTRWRPNAEWNYHNTIEIPAGVLDKGYENVLDAVKREVKEETGLDVSEIVGLEKTDIHSPKDDASYAFKPFACSQQLKAGLPWVGFCFICKVKTGEIKQQEDETRNVRWIKKSELKKMIAETPEKFFTLHLGVLEMYLKD
jgi:SAM-dependent methyltransferase